jgi:ABC-type multidrug transport system fused ATPase/permease subunit
VVLQDVFLFADTIFNNITLNNPEITKKMFWLQPRKLVHDFIMNLPDNYDFLKERRNVVVAESNENATKSTGQLSLSR